LKIANCKLGDVGVAPGGGAGPVSALRDNFQFSIFNFQFSILLWPVPLAGICGILFFYGVADRDLWSSHEARAAQDAQSILTDGCWGLPHLFDRQPELQKPPLYYWLVAAAAQLRGTVVDPWLVRLPAALAGLAGVLGLFLLGACSGRARAGVVAALVLATFVHYTWLARTARIDMPLTLAVGIALACFHLGRQRRGHGSWWYFALAYVAAAVAVMLKGPVGLVLPAPVAAVSLWADGDLPLCWRPAVWRGLAWELGLWWGVPLVLALALPWYVWANVHTRGEFFRVFFWYHNVERAFGGSGVLRGHPVWLYGPRLVVDLLPWSLLLPAAVWYLWKRGRLRADPDARFGLVWLVTMVVVLSCARFKRADYLAPAYPGAALLLACAGDCWYAAARNRRRLAVAFGAVVAACCVGWVVYVAGVLPKAERRYEDRSFAAAVRQFAPAPMPVIFFRAEEHVLMFHVGCPVDTIREWENLDWWAARPESIYVIMPPDAAAQCAAHLGRGRLERVLSNTEVAGGRHAHPLVLMRNHAGRP
jgi:4-amino-4-deoxy-L-arabinose transferase-like glycosyltransferase